MVIRVRGPGAREGNVFCRACLSVAVVPIVRGDETFGYNSSLMYCIAWTRKRPRFSGGCDRGGTVRPCAHLRGDSAGNA